MTANHDRALFGGGGAGAPPSLDAASNALRFEFAAPATSTSARPSTSRGSTASIGMVGMDATSRRRDYTNLGFGDYRFRVRARSCPAKISDEATYAFTILPPWYRTWGAYGGYIVCWLPLSSSDRVQRRRVVAKERQRAQFAEARLRADAAEALAQSESEGKKNVELLSEMGREITASLDFDTIFGKLYESVNQLADADVFGVGLYHPDRQRNRIPDGDREGQTLRALYARHPDQNQLPVWCIEHREPVFINDLEKEYRRYIRHTRKRASRSRMARCRRSRSR